MSNKVQNNIYEQYLESCLEAGLPALRLDTCCRLMAIVYVIGGSMEAFTHNRKLVADIKYAQKRLHISEKKQIKKLAKL